jgi:crossover junction endodeoxyribonuclease RuvC
MAASTTRVLGVDTALRCSGVGVVESRAGRLAAVEYGVIRHPSAWLVSECLAGLYRSITGIIARTRPEAVVIEGVFFCKNVRTAVTLGEARGSVMAACRAAGLPVYEYPARRVKQALAGSGAAEKAQVRRMVMSLLGLPEEPEEDTGDALALAVCHLHSRSRYPELAPEEI